MHIFTASVFLTSMASFALAVFVYWKGRDKALNQSLALFSLALAIWTFAQGIGTITTRETAILIWMRIQVGAAVFLPVFFLKFIFSLLALDSPKKRIIQASYLVAAIFILLDFTPWFVKDLAYVQGLKYYPKLTLVYASFALWLTTSFLFGFGHLIAALRTASGQQYQKFLYVFAASFIGFVGGATAFFPIFNINLPVVSHFALPIYVAVAVYAIVKHKLLDITVYVRKGLIYSLITTLFTALYVALLYLTNHYFQAWAHYSSVIVNILVVFGMCLIFQPLRDASQKIIDNVFFKSQYDYQETIKNISQVLSTAFRIEELNERITDLLANTIKTQNAQICLGEGQPLFDAALLVSIESKGRKWGNLCLGQKLSGDNYSPEDKNLLTTLAHQISIALENIQLYQKLARSENLAMLGTMAAGMAHEIRNPLASIKGMTQVLPENLDDPAFIGKYAEIIPRQLDRINAIVEKLLSVGRAPKMEKKETEINRLICEALDFHANLCRQQGITVTSCLAKLPPVMVDPAGVQQVFTNLIINAIEAMPGGGELKVTSHQLTVNSKIQIEIVDTGEGIPLDKIDKIFDPFFTLKEKGTGLGLFMAIRTMQEHGGTIEVKSPIHPLGKGACFAVKLPILP